MSISVKSKAGQQNRQEMRLHLNMCIIGGFLGAYAILGRASNFGSAQTLNLISITTSLLGSDFAEGMLRILALASFCAAIIIVAVARKKATDADLRRYSIITDLLGIAVLAAIPAGINPVIGLYPICFMTATQWQIFAKTGCYTSSTIFSTNNFGQFLISATEYYQEKDPSKYLRMKFFGATLLWYHIGVVFSYFTLKIAGLHAILFCLLPAASALFLTLRPHTESQAQALAAQQPDHPARTSIACNRT